MAEELHAEARALNERLESAAPEVLSMLSALGRRLYFPVGGILAQGAEAREKAHTSNATIGIATEDGGPMVLPSMTRHLVEIDPADAFDYAPPAGRPGLRERWREKLEAEHPSLRIRETDELLGQHVVKAISDAAGGVGCMVTGVGQHLLVYQPLHLQKLVGGGRLGVGEVEAQTVGRHQ